MADPERFDVDPDPTPDPNFLGGERNHLFFQNLTQLVVGNFLRNYCTVIDKKHKILVLSMGREDRRGIRG